MATIDISINEFRGFVFNELPYYFEEARVGGERAFESNIGKGYKLQILTSIPADSDVVREEGSDAIRVQVVDDTGTPVQSASHTKRTPGYRDRIKEKINELLICPKCGLDELRVSDGQYGHYFFCTGDDCGYTDSIK